MGQTGCLKYCQSTLRIGYATAQNVPVAGPQISSPSITITAPIFNTATIYFFDTAVAGQVGEPKVGVPLTKGQSFTFTGVPIGAMGYRNVSTATGNMIYFAAPATPQLVIFGFYKQV